MQSQTQTDLASAPEFTTVAQYFDTSSRRILIVEDDEIIRAIIAHAISQLGYDVDTAEDGELAWEKLNLHNYDLLITDNNMPRLTGLELVQMLRAARMSLPVILASGGTSHVDPALQIAAMLPKPFYTEQLVKVVRDVLAKTLVEADYCHFFTATLANLRCANRA
jgi:DNA-binding response OmpR family regulator